MRIAFLTPEFVTDTPDAGGLGNYLNRMTKLLVEAGHEVELFLPSELEPRVVLMHGVRVERIPHSTMPRWLKAIRKLISIVGLQKSCGIPLGFYAQALILSRALERRHKAKPFDMVQSADYRAVGLTVRGCADRRHVIRCSSAIDLYDEIDGRNDSVAKWQRRLEFLAITRADRCYAPSQFTADHYRRLLSVDVAVVRPPRSLEMQPAETLPLQLPSRYFLHFGQIMKRKGTEWLAKSLVKAFEEEPTIRIVMLGPADSGFLNGIMRPLLPHRDKIILLYPMPKPQVLKILMGAEAALLPSLVDNLPNTVIESLSLGIPVIGTRGASIDELVEDRVTGRLVTANDVTGLSEAIIESWRGNVAYTKGFVWDNAIANEMNSDRAIQNLLSLCNGQRH